MPTFTVVQPTCPVATGSITVTAPLGATYEYQLDNGAWQSSVNFTTVSSGAHTIKVRSTTDNTCTNSAPVTINNQPTPPTAPTVNVVQPTCAVATATVTITSSTTGLEVSVDGGAYAPYPAGGYTLASGGHTITVRSTADNTCTAQTPVTVNAQPTPPACQIMAGIIF